MKSIVISLLALAACQIAVSAPLTTQSTHISFFSSTPAEDIESNNYSVTSLIDSETGRIAFSVPMQAFEFEKALMQKHFNQDKFLDTKQYPRASFTGYIQNHDSIDLNAPGSHEVVVKGELEIKAVKRPIEQSGAIEITAASIDARSKFDLVLADYGIEFKGGKPAKNIAKTIAVTVNSQYSR